MALTLTAEVQATEPPRVQLTVTGIGADTPLLTNGGFESDIDPWVPGPGVTLIAAPTTDTDGNPIPPVGPAPVEGNKYGYATYASPADTGQTLMFSQQATVEPGAIVATRAWLAGTDTVPATLRVTATTGGVPSTESRVQDSVELSTAWQQFQPPNLQLAEENDGILVEILITPPSGEVARNLMIDPAAQGTNAATSWSTSGGAAPLPTLDTTVGHDDLRSFLVAKATAPRVAVNMPPDATQVTCSGWIYAAAGTTYGLLIGGDAVNNTRSPTYTATGEWEFRTLTADIVNPGGEVRFVPINSPTNTAWVDDLGLTVGASPVRFNGDTPDEGIYSYSWEGTPYASASVKAIADPLNVEVFADEATAIIPGDSGTITIYRVVESNYTPVRGMLDYSPTTSTIVAYDLGAPFGVPVTYQLVQIHSDGSTTSVTAGPVFLTADSSWLSHPITGEGVEVTIKNWTELTYGARQNIVEISGRAAPIVISDKRLRPSSELVFYTDTRADLMALRQLLATGDILQMRPVCDAVEPDYLAIGEVKETRVVEDGPGSGMNWQRTITLAAQAVDQPAPAIPATGDTLADLHAHVPGTLADFPVVFGDASTLLDIATTPLTIT